MCATVTGCHFGATLYHELVFLSGYKLSNVTTIPPHKKKLAVPKTLGLY